MGSSSLEVAPTTLAQELNYLAVTYLQFQTEVCILAMSARLVSYRASVAEKKHFYPVTIFDL